VQSAVPPEEVVKHAQMEVQKLEAQAQAQAVAAMQVSAAAQRAEAEAQKHLVVHAQVAAQAQQLQAKAVHLQVRWGLLGLSIKRALGGSCPAKACACVARVFGIQYLVRRLTGLGRIGSVHLVCVVYLHVSMLSLERICVTQAGVPRCRSMRSSSPPLLLQQRQQSLQLTLCAWPPQLAPTPLPLLLRCQCQAAAWSARLCWQQHQACRCGAVMLAGQ
jgi:hypothetical protein